MEKEQQQQGPLSIDWSLLLDKPSPPRELVVVPSSAMASDQPPADDLDAVPDHKLKESILSKKRTLDVTGKNLPDAGAKLRATIDRYQQELSRRELKRLRQEVDEDRKPQHGQATSSSAVSEGVSNDLREENLSSQALPQSSFASSFVKKMEDNTNCTASDAFRKETSHFKCCDNQKIQDNGEPKRRKRFRPSSRQLQFQCPSKLSKCDTLSDGKTCRATSTFSLWNIGRDLSRCYPKVSTSSSNHHHLLQKTIHMISSSAPFSTYAEDGGRYGLKDASQAIQLDGSRSRKGKPIVLDVDDDDDDDDEAAHIVEKTENKFAEYLKEAKIYFPSRDDPECVEICYTDTDCLAPEGYLTSTIMNFYIQYLQQQASLTNRSLSDYHFFNTYFYKKLKEAVSYKQSDRAMIFAKFRRWWKGVNIFQKAYVLIPIHE
ncbi:Ubiquitin-like-specific protease 1D, partial [Mucuna pruriens]